MSPKLDDELVGALLDAPPSMCKRWRRCRYLELADLLRDNWDGPIEQHELVELTFACEVRPLLSIRAA